MTAPLKPHPDFRMAHPGELLLADFEALGIGKAEFARRLGVTRKALYDILDGKTGISATMALRLEAVVGSSAEFWLGLQTQHDLWKARQAMKGVMKGKKSSAKPQTKSKAPARAKRAAA
jgi:antitoxin HigA-1